MLVSFLFCFFFFFFIFCAQPTLRKGKVFSFMEPQLVLKSVFIARGDELRLFS